MLTHEQVPAYILAGGRSQRFQIEGTQQPLDKAFVEVRGQPQIQHLARQLLAQKHLVTIVAARDEASRFQFLSSFSVNCIEDTLSEIGPVAGLMQALKHRRANAGRGWLLLLACDQLLWKADWFLSLRACAGSDAGEAVSSHVCKTGGEPNNLMSENPKEPLVITLSESSLPSRESAVPQPLPALYHVDVLPTVVRCVQNADYAMRSVLRQAASISVPTPDHPKNWSFNTQAELAAIAHLLPSIGH